MTEYLELEDLLDLTDDLGVGPVRDLGLLASAAHRPSTTLFGTYAYPGLDEKAAALLESIVRDHALIDGNKRLGWLATYVFYRLNGVSIEVEDDPGYDLVIAVATGELDVSGSAARLSHLH